MQLSSAPRAPSWQTIAAATSRSRQHQPRADAAATGPLPRLATPLASAALRTRRPPRTPPSRGTPAPAPDAHGAKPRGAPRRAPSALPRPRRASLPGTTLGPLSWVPRRRSTTHDPKKRDPNTTVHFVAGIIHGTQSSWRETSWAALQSSEVQQLGGGSRKTGHKDRGGDTGRGGATLLWAPRVRVW